MIIGIILAALLVLYIAGIEPRDPSDLRDRRD